MAGWQGWEPKCALPRWLTTDSSAQFLLDLAQVRTDRWR